MDEQRLRARLAALRVAFPDFPTVQQAGSRLDLAERLEDWLMRPAPIDVSKVDDGAPHVAETTADRLGYPRCPVTWPGSGVHSCIRVANHPGDHECQCGEELRAQG